MKKKPFQLLAFPLVMAAPFLVAQEPRPPAPAAYRVQFFLTQAQANQPPAVHSYTLRLSSSGASNSVEVGTRVPVQAGPDKYNYERVGLTLDCNLSRPSPAQSAEELRLEVYVNVSSATPGTAPYLPIIHAADSRVDTAVPLGRRVTVAEFGDPASGATYQLEVMAEPAAPSGE